MVIPKSVKIGGIRYSVRLEYDWQGRDGADGELFYSNSYGNTIFIGKELTRQAQETTFIHEALHAMNATVDHEFLDSLAEQLYQFFSDNKLFK